jgi:hypothetical protein
MSRKRTKPIFATILVSAGLMTGQAYVFSGWMSHPLAYFAPLVMLWVTGAFLYGVRRSPHSAILPRLAAGAAWAVVPVAAFAVSLLVRWLTLARVISETPLVEPKPELMSSRIDVVRYDRTMDYSVYYHTAVPYEDVCRFYETEIPARGWTVVRWEARAYKGAGRHVLCEFLRDGERNLAEIGELTGDRSIPGVYTVGGASVHIQPYPDSDRPPAFLPRL